MSLAIKLSKEAQGTTVVYGGQQEKRPSLLGRVAKGVALGGLALGGVAALRSGAIGAGRASYGIRRAAGQGVGESLGGSARHGAGLMGEEIKSWGQKIKSSVTPGEGAGPVPAAIRNARAATETPRMRRARQVFQGTQSPNPATLGTQVSVAAKGARRAMAGKADPTSLRYRLFGKGADMTSALEFMHLYAQEKTAGRGPVVVTKPVVQPPTEDKLESALDYVRVNQLGQGAATMVKQEHDHSLARRAIQNSISR